MAAEQHGSEDGSEDGSGDGPNRWGGTGVRSSRDGQPLPSPAADPLSYDEMCEIVEALRKQVHDEDEKLDEVCCRIDAAAVAVAAICCCHMLNCTNGHAGSSKRHGPRCREPSGMFPWCPIAW
jgi:hypothetical protein